MRLLLVRLSILPLLASFSPANAQCIVTAADSVRPPDVRILARVSAAELRFDRQPRASVLVAGCASGDTVRITARRNLPERVVAGETYRDVEVMVEIVTRLSVVCSPELRRMLGRTDAAPRLVALCARNDTTAGNGGRQ